MGGIGEGGDPLLGSFVGPDGDGPFAPLPPTVGRAPRRRWRYGPVRALLLVLVLLVPGVVDPLTRHEAERLLLGRVHGAAAAAGRPNRLLQAEPRHQATPPAPSGANPPYPFNHTFDADVVPVGTPPANFDFETPGYAAGTPSANFDFSAAPVDVGTPAANWDFASGTFAGWTTAQSPTIQTAGGPEGN